MGAIVDGYYAGLAADGEIFIGSEGAVLLEGSTA